MSMGDDSQRDNAGVFVPPPLLFAGTLAAGALADHLLTSWSLGLGAIGRNSLASPFALIGALLIAAALGLFRKERTRPEPWQPSTALVTRGIYRFTRNPMYLGMAFIYGGLAVGLDSPVACALIAPLIAIIHFSVIAREERYLAQKFGASYRQYKATVRAWL